MSSLAKAPNDDAFVLKAVTKHDCKASVMGQISQHISDLSSRMYEKDTVLGSSRYEMEHTAAFTEPLELGINKTNHFVEISRSSHKGTGLESRLLSLERSGHETKEILSTIPSILQENLDRQTKATQALVPLLNGIAASLDSILDRNAHGKTDLTCVMESVEQQTRSWRQVNSKLEAESSLLRRVESLVQKVPKVDNFLEGVETLLASHADEISGKVAAEVRQLKPLPDSHSMKRIDHSQDVMATLRSELEEQFKMLHCKVDSHSKCISSLVSQMDGLPTDFRRELEDQGKHITQLIDHVDRMPDHNLLVEHLLTGIQSLLLEDVSRKRYVLNERMDILAERMDVSHVKRLLDDHTNRLHVKLNSIQKTQSDIARVIEDTPSTCKTVHSLLATLESQHWRQDELEKRLANGYPDIASLMNGWNSLLSEHMSEHGSKLATASEKLPRATDNSDLIRALDMNSSKTLEAIEQLRPKGDISIVRHWLEDHASAVHGKIDRVFEMHDRLAKFIETVAEQMHGKLADHISHTCQTIASLIHSLPLPRDNHELLGNIQSMLEKAQEENPEAIKSSETGTSDILEAQSQRRSEQMTDAKTPCDLASLQQCLLDHSEQLQRKLDRQNEKQDELAGNIMKGMLDSVLHQTFEAVANSRKEADLSCVQYWLADHSTKIVSAIHEISSHGNDTKLLQSIEDRASMTTEAISDLRDVLGRTLETISTLQRSSNLNDAINTIHTLSRNSADLNSAEREEGNRARWLEMQFHDGHLIQREFIAESEMACSEPSDAAADVPSFTTPAKLKTTSQAAHERLSPPKESAGYSNELIRCQCGYTCGTELALLRHRKNCCSFEKDWG